MLAGGVSFGTARQGSLSLHSLLRDEVTMPVPGQWEPRRTRAVTPVVGVSDELNRVRDAVPPALAPGRASTPVEKTHMFRGSREPGPWFKASFAGVVLLGGMLLAMWAQRGPSLCALSPEASRRLQLSRPGDREHLATDNASATRSAQQYVAAEVDTPERQQRFLECESLLVRNIAATHDVSVEQVRSSAEHTP